MKTKIIACGNGIATLRQQKFIKWLEEFGCPIYTGRTVKDASKYISANEHTYEEYMNDQSAMDAAFNDHGQY